jgi:hypothetical protein
VEDEGVGLGSSAEIGMIVVGKIVGEVVDVTPMAVGNDGDDDDRRGDGRIIVRFWRRSRRLALSAFSSSMTPALDRG